MKYETRIPFFLIVRHLLRGSKWTLLLIIFLVSVAFINLVFITSLFNGIIESSNNQIINTNTGHISITPKEGEDFIDDASSVINIVENTEGVEAASSHTLVPATMKHKNTKGNFTTLAINPDDEKKVTNISENMDEGSYLEKGDADGIILGRQIAGGKDVENVSAFDEAKVGEKVSLSFDGVEKDFEIMGIFDSNYIETDYRAFITEEALDELIPDSGDIATTIVIRIGEKGNEQEVIDRLEDEGIDDQLHSWKDMAGLMKGVTKSFLSIDVLLSAVGALIAAATIFIVIYIDISDKRQQIGILRAIGIKPYLIRSVYILQSTIYSVCGVLLGTIVFFGVLVPYFKAYPFKLPIGDAVLVVNYADFVIRSEIIVVVAILSGLIPAIMVTRMPMLDEILGK